MPDTSLTDLSETLAAFISGSHATFICGGSIPLTDFEAAQFPRHQQDGSGSSTAAAADSGSGSGPGPGPIILRWDREDGSVGKVCLPVEGAGHEDGAQKQALEKLVSDCQPAGFGHLGKDEYDEKVRKAWALDSSRFSTNVCPYMLGIADRITQLLLPNAAGMAAGGLASGGIIKAEPYKLNVYKGPSGFFKSHVDTPRGKTHFASLVLCLPSVHKGGRLSVSHADLDPVNCDWDGPEGVHSLQWAAFYSDCMHEVHEVTEGYRLTLTYNLYYVLPSIKHDVALELRRKPAPVDITKLAPYTKMQALLEDPEWMKDGGVLGIYCSHAYATTTSTVSGDYRSDDVPEGDEFGMLKGTDMSLYAVFASLNLKVVVKPVYDMRSFYFTENEETDKGPIVSKEKPGVITMTETGCYDDYEVDLTEFGQRPNNITWVTEPEWKNLALIHGTYGNEAGTAVAYTHTALLVTIPTTAKRNGKK